MHGAAKFDPSEKPWGIQRPILRNSPLHVDEIEVVPGGYCSVHRHLKKVNLFHVLSGKLAIFEFNDEGLIVKTDPLTAGEFCIVEAGKWHQFWSETGCTAQEVYYGTEEELRVGPGDIDRKAGLALGGVSTMLAGVPSMRGVYLAEAGS